MNGARALLVLLSLLAFVTPAAGVQQDSTVLVRLDSIRVTIARGMVPLGRVPLSLATLDAATIGGAQATVGLDEALDRVPGIFINNRYNLSLGSRISIRGLGARAAFGVRGIRVLSDGIPLTMPDGQTNLNNLELGSTGRIEVLRGPSSALYGNAAGGVISIESALPPAVFSTELRALGGNAGRDGLRVDPFFKVQARAGGPMSDGGFTASVSRMETDGYRDFSRAKQTLVNLVARHPLGENARISLVLNGFDSPVAESAGALPIDSVRRNPTMAWPNNVRTGSGEATQQVQVGVAIAQAFGSNRLDIALHGLGRNVDNALPFGYIDLRRRGGGARASWTGSRGDRFDITSGVDVEWMSDDRTEWDNVGGGPGEDLRRDQTDQVASVGPFAQVLFAASDRIDLLAGFRYDAVRFETKDAFLSDGDDSGSRTLSAASPTLGLSWSVDPDLRLFANVGTAFQTPTTTELINAPPAPGEACCPGGFNTDLEPQRVTNFEVGTRGRLGRIELSAAAYHMNVRNTILPYQVADGEGREFFRNAGESRHRGLELSASTRFGLHGVTLAWTFNDFVFTDDGDPDTVFEGNRLPGVPRNHVFAGLELVPVPTVRINLELDHAGEYFANDGNTATNEAATVVDVRVQYEARVGNALVRPFAAINNLTSTRYNSSVVVNGFGGRYFEPAPPRNVYLGFAIATGAWRAP